MAKTKRTKRRHQIRQRQKRRMKRKKLLEKSKQQATVTEQDKPKSQI